MEAGSASPILVQCLNRESVIEEILRAAGQPSVQMLEAISFPQIAGNPLSSQASMLGHVALNAS